MPGVGTAGKAAARAAGAPSGDASPITSTEEKASEESMEENQSEETISEDSDNVPDNVPAKLTVTKKSVAVQKRDTLPQSRKRQHSFSPARMPNKKPAKIASMPAGDSSNQTSTAVHQEPSEESMEEENSEETISDDSDDVPTKSTTAKKDVKKEVVQKEDTPAQSRKRQQSFSPARAKSASPARCAGFKSWADSIRIHLSQYCKPPGTLESDEDSSFADAKAGPPSTPPPPKKQKLQANLSEKELDRYMSKVWG